MKKILLTIATVLFLTAPASASHKTLDNMFTFHAFCNFIAQSASIADNYKACVANQTELFASFGDTIDYLAARDQHKSEMQTFYNALPTEHMTMRGVLNAMYADRKEI